MVKCFQLMKSRFPNEHINLYAIDIKHIQLAYINICDLIDHCVKVIISPHNGR